MTSKKELVACFLILFFLTLNQTLAQKRFSGPIFDIAVSQEHVIGGSLIDGIDVLSENTRSVFSVGAGYRYQFNNGLVIGASVSKGWLNGDMNLETETLSVAWKNDSQWDWEANVGMAFANRFHVFLFASEVTRKFDVEITRGGIQFSQTDEQGMLRIGAGGEAYLVRGLSVRLKIGTGRADFGDQITNIEVKRKAHFSAGLRFTL